jgi:aspartate ammonia-lyase
MSDQRADTAFRNSTRTRSAVAPASNSGRWETDGLGRKQIPAEVYWGINVSRALDNFSISGRPISIHPDLIFAFACVKQAAARANAEIGALEPLRAGLIDRACEDIKNGKLHDQFVVDVMQGGAGTSTNMNFNEVIANRGLELAGHPKGNYEHLDPNDDVNRSQSTNDAYPTALKIGMSLALERVIVELAFLAQAFQTRAHSFAGIVKVGRTQLQDAVPMTLGQEFDAFAVTLAEDRAGLDAIRRRLWEVNLGATAIGTSIAADRGYTEAVCRHLAAITAYPIITAPNLIEATTDVSVFLELSGALKRFAMKLSKICNDLRLLSSGPQAGFCEINLPAKQAGSSIMPGKVNPVVPELVNQVAFAIAGGRCHRDDGCRSRAAPAQRVRAGDGACALRKPEVADGSDGHIAGELRRRNYRESRASGEAGRIVCRRDHSTRPRDRLRPGGTTCETGTCDGREDH